MWEALRRALKAAGWLGTRLETWAIPGIPDVLAAAPDGTLALIELKTTLNRRVRVSPHQAAFLSTYSSHGAPVWFLIRQGIGENSVWLLYPGSEATRLALYPFDVDDPRAAGIWHGRLPDWPALLACVIRRAPDSLSEPRGVRGNRRIDTDGTLEQTRRGVIAAEMGVRWREKTAEVRPEYDAGLPAPRAGNRYVRKYGNR